MYIYAQLDKNNTCIGVSSLSGEVSNASMVRMDTYTVDVLGKRYVDGEWQDVPKEPISPEPTQDENFNLMMLEAIADSYEQGMKQEEQNLAILDGIASLYEAQLGAEGVTK